jgi:hypothetical protein
LQQLWVDEPTRERGQCDLCLDPRERSAEAAVHAAEAEVPIVAVGRLKPIRIVKLFRIAIAGREHQNDRRIFPYSDTRKLDLDQGGGLRQHCTGGSSRNSSSATMGINAGSP